MGRSGQAVELVLVQGWKMVNADNCVLLVAYGMGQPKAQNQEQATRLSGRERKRGIERIIMNLVRKRLT
jgi:hypothetical protein